MARIGNSVYRDICPGDPTCSQFGFYQGGTPTPMMEECLLYNLVQYGRPGIKVNESLFQHVFTSKYGKMRIFKIKRVSLKSKQWVANQTNRVCDAPGSWYCTGQYPPALKPLIARRKNFAQLEDFNSAKTEQDKKYQEEYHKRMDGMRGGGSQSGSKSQSVGAKYLGCYGAEGNLGSDRVYEGGSYGSNIGLARQFAKETGMKYFAVARANSEGHLFAFSTFDKTKSKMPDSECNHPCLDQDDYKCGCADELCRGLKAVKGEDNVRRWSVYEVVDKKKKAKKRDKSEL